MKARALSDRGMDAQIANLPRVLYFSSFLGNRGEGFYHG